MKNTFVMLMAASAMLFGAASAQAAPRKPAKSEPCRTVRFRLPEAPGAAMRIAFLGDTPASASRCFNGSKLSDGSTFAKDSQASENFKIHSKIYGLPVAEAFILRGSPGSVAEVTVPASYLVRGALILNAERDAKPYFSGALGIDHTNFSSGPVRDLTAHRWSFN